MLFFGQVGFVDVHADYYQVDNSKKKTVNETLSGFGHQVPGLEAAGQSAIQHWQTFPCCGQVYRGGCGCWRGGACQLPHGGE